MQKRGQISSSGFTLIELSIVLVIIGLIVGGVLVGQDLIRAAEVRATISQIEKYQTAVNTFLGKYGYLPGDMNAATAAQFGFASRAGTAGMGDGNGVIEGNSYGTAYGWMVGSGENLLFWNDLGIAGLVDGGFSNDGLSSNVTGGACSVEAYFATAGCTATSPPVSAFLPTAKLEAGNYIYVWSGGYGVDEGDSGSGGATNLPSYPSDSINYFGLSEMPGGLNGGWPFTAPGITPAKAYNIDKKADDGLPQSGHIIAMYPNDYSGDYMMLWAQGGQSPNSYVSAPSIQNPAATFGSPTTCYDNGGNISSPMQYSIEINNGTGVNCALSFRFQ